MEQALIDQAIGFLVQYRDALVVSYSSTGRDGKQHLMTLEQCRDDLDVAALKDIASLEELIRKNAVRRTPVL